MANTKIIFLDDSNHSLSCYVNHANKLYLHIVGDGLDVDDSQYIELDKSTAIKFSKTLRTEISKMEDE